MRWWTRFVALAAVTAALAGAAVAGAQPATPAPPDTAKAFAGDPRQPASAPFAFADFSWVPGNAGASERPLTFGPFTGEFRMDDVFHYSFARPIDNTISGSSEVFRHGEFQVTQLGIGGDIFYKNVMGRIMTQFGMYSTTTPRNDASPVADNGASTTPRPTRLRAATREIPDRSSPTGRPICRRSSGASPSPCW